MLPLDRTDRLFHETKLSGGSVAGAVCSQPAGNCQAPDVFDALTSNRTARVLADDFTPTSSGNLTSVCWWGAYGRGTPGNFVDCQPDTVDSIELTYYNDAGGFPGTIVAAFSQAAGTLTLSGPVATGNTVAGQVPEYSFSATHAAVPVVAGSCYWVSITNNPAADCFWFWVVSMEGNGRAIQDGDAVSVPNGFTLDEAISNDLSFCLDAALGDSTACLPAPPLNDDYGSAEDISGVGDFAFDTTTATDDGLPPASCLPNANVQLEADVWFCWTAPCDGTVLVSTCQTTVIDTMVAVYDGCGPTLPGEAELLTCNDDRCVSSQPTRQSMAVFTAVATQTYSIRVGVFPGEPRGPGAIRIECGPPNNLACGVAGSGDCCNDAGTGSVGCESEACCELVCACDSFCCDVAWDSGCAQGGLLVSGCGADFLCDNECVICGDPLGGDCCSANDSRGCSDAACCSAVCQTDSFCCDRFWDASCVTLALAETACQPVCNPISCPVGSISFVDPPDGVVDARQPHPPFDALMTQGIEILTLTAPTMADAACFTLCETADTGTPNSIFRVSESVEGYTVRLTRPITPGAVTTLTYTDDNGLATTGRFTSQPANVNADSSANDIDTAILANFVSGVGGALPFGLYSGDADHSGAIGPADILRVIDLLNGGDSLAPWRNVARPTSVGTCP